MTTSEAWVPMKEAVKILRVSRYKLTQLVTAGLIETRDNIRDKREMLVNITQAKEVLGIK